MLQMPQEIPRLMVVHIHQIFGKGSLLNEAFWGRNTTNNKKLSNLGAESPIQSIEKFPLLCITQKTIQKVARKGDTKVIMKMTLVISNNENYIIINVVFVGELCSPCVQSDNLCSETCFEGTSLAGGGRCKCYQPLESQLCVLITRLSL